MEERGVVGKVFQVFGNTLAGLAILAPLDRFLPNMTQKTLKSERLIPAAGEWPWCSKGGPGANSQTLKGLGADAREARNQSC